MSTTMNDPTSIRTDDTASNNNVHIKGIGTMEIPSKRASKPSLSPIPRPKPKLSGIKLGPPGGMKTSLSTGSLKRNKISFGDTSTLVYEKDIDGEDEEQKNAVWYSKKEMKTIRKDLKKSIKKGDISRGLEQYEGDMGEENKQKRLNHIYSILDLQREQQEKGVQDDQSLHMLSRAMSADDIGRARRLASVDSKEAFREYQQNSNILRSTSKNALDNFRKAMESQTGRALPSRGLKNATFGTFGSSKKNSGATKSKGAPNLLLQAMANKKKNKQEAAATTQAGVA